MRITCPLCGERDRREFYYRGAALEAPAEGGSLEAWHAHVHLRDNPAGPVEEWWYHQQGCGSWIRVRRDTSSHEMLAAQLASAQEDL
ncbi:sarcosine oxidase subunit delta [Phaeobacter inhibens]|uniref:sarcosine oxidase subunit delta n=1 Tax=Phaeobacter inhibens TaxID=221822 RepID=UPI000C9CF3F3|nr:sarcosine oxidase subunit delta [Phaeobacter inhibens]AUQ69756.1 sarcosine oxidase subunit delta [Phaeobacter inhibens]UWR65463.1 sarcosine oxidase subunit delta [Phaeobacter inhibens]UWR85276.1 sarcosine oxidase subunit delta [Phaeobacter inhibens]UWR93280.1 sarcosine oxidase subunit delta [Phaeobacter inhibens]